MKKKGLPENVKNTRRIIDIDEGFEYKLTPGMSSDEQEKDLLKQRAKQLKEKA